MCDFNKESQKCHPWKRKGELSSIFVPLLFPMYVLRRIWLLHRPPLLPAHARSAVTWLQLLTCRKDLTACRGLLRRTPLISSAELKLLLPLASSFLIPVIFLFLPVRRDLVFFVTVKSVVTSWANPSTDSREPEGEDADAPQQSA